MKLPFAMLGLCLAIAASAHSAPGQNTPTKEDAQRRWTHAPAKVDPMRGVFFAATQAGQRIVAVGDHGLVVLSEDGKTFKQAQKVPTRSPLTSVHFHDAKQGWIAGHDGTILGTRDGGEHWEVLRQERGKDEVLLSIWFADAQHGFAVGQFGLALETHDGGKTWARRTLSTQTHGAEKHLIHLFPGRQGLLFIAAESGTIFRSADSGKTWQAIQTANKGSFWTGKALRDGSLLAAGMRGHVYRSQDQGLSWTATDSGTQQSLTAIHERQNASVLITGTGGVLLQRTGTDPAFKRHTRADNASLTGVVSHASGDVFVSTAGILRND
ncbi:YCF48-related protein [Limnohabitans sp.]|uniref:WD40/YVTN/BNR-like repeat-containing protein n=1 Tax=Limnohabitans sp. TaxID=1907725 RepID=UPI0025C10F65|nr:YCF48-related protein [Limnohabitans sp.]